MVVQDNDPRAARRPRGRPRASGERADQTTIKSLDRGLAVLAHLARIESATLSGLAQAMGESPATIHRVLATLARHGLAEADEAAQTWHVGPGAFLVGSVFLRRTSLVERSRPHLRALMERTGETANLGVEAQGAVLFVSQVETHAPIRAFFPPGTRSPFHASGIGKVLLAHGPEARVERLVGGGLERFTARTITAPSALQSELGAIRARGYAVDDEERNEGMRCIAAPVRNALGEVVAGLSVSGPTSRVTRDDEEGLALAVVEASRAVSAALGARATPPPG